MKYFFVSFLLVCTSFAQDTIKEGLGQIESLNNSQGSLADCNSSSELVRTWAHENIQQLSLIPDTNRGSLYFLISTFYCRLKDWRSYKPFYDQLFARPEIKNAYPDALPQEKTSSGFFIRVLSKGEKITYKGSPLEHLTGKTIEEVFGYKGDKRIFDKTPAMGSRQLMFLQPNYFTHQHTGRYNTGYHEFGHFLHLSLMTSQEYNKIESLYKEQRAANNFLDDYAAGSSAEYFAQGLEAFLSETKPGVTSKYQKHTKEDLRTRDPKLYGFIKDFIASSKICNLPN